MQEQLDRREYNEESAVPVTLHHRRHGVHCEVGVGAKLQRQRRAVAADQVNEKAAVEQAAAVVPRARWRG